MFTNPRPRKFLVHASALCTVALLGAACGGAGEDDSADAADTGIESDPLMAGLLDGKTFEEAEFEVQTKTQECMTALGWEYTAVAPGSTGTGGAIVPDDTDLDEFAATSGYGITTSGADGAVMIDGAGTVGVSGGSTDSDPNAAYVATLSQADQTAYYNDLFGPPVEFDVDASVDAMAPMTPAGCMGDATTAVYGEGAFEQLNDQFMEVDARVQADARIIDAFAAWSACMADAGYTYAKPTETFDDFFARMSALGQDPDPAALKALQEEEIATATADRACAKETDLDTIQQEVFEEISAEVASGS